MIIGRGYSNARKGYSGCRKKVHQGRQQTKITITRYEITLSIPYNVVAPTTSPRTTSYRSTDCNLGETKTNIYQVPVVSTTRMFVEVVSNHSSTAMGTTVGGGEGRSYLGKIACNIPHAIKRFEVLSYISPASHRWNMESAEVLLVIGTIPHAHGHCALLW